MNDVCTRNNFAFCQLDYRTYRTCRTSPTLRVGIGRGNILTSPGPWAEQVLRVLQVLWRQVVAQGASVRTLTRSFGGRPGTVVAWQMTLTLDVECEDGTKARAMGDGQEWRWVESGEEQGG